MVASAERPPRCASRRTCQHSDLLGTFYVDVDGPRCHIALSGPAEPLLAVVECLRAELVATLAAAGRSDLIRLPEAEPATAGS